MAWANLWGIEKLPIPTDKLWHPDITAEFYREQIIDKQELLALKDGTIRYQMVVNLRVSVASTRSLQIELRDFAASFVTASRVL
eukprot:476623-Prorocentrum_minimum.AAC.3